MQQIDIAAIADKLTANQRSTIEGLDAKNFVVLGCAEPTAIRLCRDGTRRPALVERIKGSEYWCFRLTDLGRRVKNELAHMAFAGPEFDRRPPR